LTDQILVRFPAQVLRLNAAGSPLHWISREAAASLFLAGRVLWTLGDSTFVMRGGINRLGVQTELQLPTIMASSGRVNDHHRTSSAQPTRRLLFRRDRNICLYCGQKFSNHFLTIDHVIARSRGGGNSWSNLVTACLRCNQRKGAKTPEEAGMPLLAVPFAPNRMELLYLSNKHILADQMSYLESGFSPNMSSSAQSQ